MQGLIQCITQWKKLEGEITNTPFFSLRLKNKQIEANKLHKNLLSIGKCFENPAILKKVSEEMQKFNRLLEQVACLDKVLLLPKTAMSKILNSLKLTNDQFAIKDINLIALNANYNQIQDLLYEYKEEIKAADELQAIRNEMESLCFELHHSSGHYIIECESIAEILEADALRVEVVLGRVISLSLIHISEPTRPY
eukprot:TRINITY_DN1108_c0_g1_i8.p1 TRINITY_DN1108_c0_g1~~TRINITY_DN1108_c0_g1_i8.p1  ORF type:complete len:196 (+),score=30.82 TRINITY_DN1108_c0_g1_i8:122-709(+)